MPGKALDTREAHRAHGNASFPLRRHGQNRPEGPGVPDCACHRRGKAVPGAGDHRHPGRNGRRTAQRGHGQSACLPHGPGGRIPPQRRRGGRPAPPHCQGGGQQSLPPGRPGGSGLGKSRGRKVPAPAQHGADRRPGRRLHCPEPFPRGCADLLAATLFLAALYE